MEVQKYEIKFFPVGNSKKGGDAIFIRLYDKDDNVVVILIDESTLKSGIFEIQSDLYGYSV